MSSSLYFNEADEDFPADEQSCRAAFEFYLRQPYFKVMEVDGEVVGWLMASNGAGNYHSTVKALSQLYYHTTLSGVKAVRALITFHEHLFAWAEQHKYEIVVTSSVIAASQDVFRRVLEKAGWSDCGRHLTRRTRWHRSDPERHAGTRSGRPGTQTLGASRSGQAGL